MEDKLPYENMVEEMAREYAKVKAPSYIAPAFGGESTSTEKNLIRPINNLFRGYTALKEAVDNLFHTVKNNELREMVLIILKGIDGSLELLSARCEELTGKKPQYKPKNAPKSAYGDAVRKSLLLHSEILEMLKLYRPMFGYGRLFDSLKDEAAYISFRLTALIAF